MTPDRSHSDIVGRVANKVRVEGGFVPFNPYFYVPKYRYSDALPLRQRFLILLILFATNYFFTFLSAISSSS